MSELAGISVIITAYNAKDFVRECLTSVKNILSRAGFPWEVLVGVDGCQETLDAVLMLGAQPNTKVFWFSQNRGTYITSNSLIARKAFSRVFRFDADDVMCAGSARYLHPAVSPPGKLYRVPYYNFCTVGGRIVFRGPGKMYLPQTANLTLSPAARPSYEHAVGTVIFDDKVLAAVGGYRPWMCAADTDLMQRTLRAGFPVVKVRPVYGPAQYRRRHPTSLTCAAATGARSALRLGYKAEAARQQLIWVDPVTAPCERVL